MLFYVFLLSLQLNLLAFENSNRNNSCFIDVPFIKQENNFCGAASLAMVFQYWGKNISQYSIADKIYIKSKKGINSETLKSFSEESGFLAFIYRGELANIKESIKKGRPLIVAVSSEASNGFHYIVIVGFDENLSLILVNDPYVGKLEKMKFQQFMVKWRKSNYWTLLVLPK
jgi:ABC-type bacteriocin/lantibiotic exporter with double-glycine peptidase domain